MDSQAAAVLPRGPQPGANRFVGSPAVRLHTDDMTERHRALIRFAEGGIARLTDTEPR
jgi:hypothetical protein